MAAPCEDVSDNGTKDNSHLFCNIEATVPTGFEPVAKEEAEEKCGVVTKVSRGKINIKIPVEKAKQVLELRGIDHCRVVLSQVPHFGFTESQHDNLLRLRQFVGEVDWPHGLMVWRKFFTFEHPVADVPEVITDDFGEVTEPVQRQSKSDGKASKKSKKNMKWKKPKSNSTVDNNELPVHKEKELGDTESTVHKHENETEALGSKGENEVDETEIKQSTENQTCIDQRDFGSQKDDVEGTDNKGNATELAESEVNAESKKPRTRINPWDTMKPAFRVTCNRVGDNHNFDSMTAAANFGGAVYRYFGWNVEMKNFDIEVMLNIEDEEVTVGIGLTRESLHRRNIGHFGPTTLRPTIAYNMLRLCEVKTGDIVCDPMCGSGSIPIQAALSWPHIYNIGGDNSKKAVWRTKDNLQYMKEQREKENNQPPEVEVIKWDACNLPLKTHSVDVFITDLPFGVRMGSKVNNWKLYSGALMEMARVVKPETGRVCLLTQDKKCMIKTLQTNARYWTRTKTVGINIGGLAAAVFLLLRTADPHTNTSQTNLKNADVETETNNLK